MIDTEKREKILQKFVKVEKLFRRGKMQNLQRILKILMKLLLVKVLDFPMIKRFLRKMIDILFYQRLMEMLVMNGIIQVEISNF